MMQTSSRCTAAALNLLRTPPRCALYRCVTFLPPSPSRFHSAKPGNLEPMSGAWERRGARSDDWKTKQRRFTRHITNLVRKGKVEEAEQVYRDMLTADVRPSTAVFNNLIAGLSKSGHAHRAFKYFNDLKKRGLSPTQHTYTSLFKAIGKDGQSSRPLLDKVVAEIDRRDFLLNTIATNSLMVAMTMCGAGTEETFGVYGDMIRRGESPDVFTFSLLLSALSRDRERGLEKVEQLWREMVAMGTHPDLRCYQSLLRCLREAGAPGEMREWGDVKLSVSPQNSSSDISLVSEYSRSEFSESDLTEKVTEFCCRSNKKSHVAMDGARISGKRSELVSVVSHSRVKLRLFSNEIAPLTLQMTKSDWRFMDADNVARLLSAMKRGGVAPDKLTLDILSKMTIEWVGVARSTRTRDGHTKFMNNS